MMTLNDEDAGLATLWTRWHFSSSYLLFCNQKFLFCFHYRLAHKNRFFFCKFFAFKQIFILLKKKGWA